MTQIDRKRKIMEELTVRGVVNIPELSERLGVSSMTIRRDLTKLSQQGLVTLERGGAVLNASSLFERGISLKQEAMVQEKIRIAQKCAELVKEGDSVFLDAGTTVAEIARILARRKGISIITNSLLTANFLSRSSESKVIMCPGEFRKTSMAFMGPMTDEFIGQFQVDILFLGVEGVDLKNGLTVPDTTDGMTKRAMVNHAQRIVCAADSSKVGLTFLHRICSLSEMHTLVTDEGFHMEAARDYLHQGVTVERV